MTMKGTLFINSQSLNRFMFAIIQRNIFKFKCIMLFIFTTYSSDFLLGSELYDFQRTSQSEPST